MKVRGAYNEMIVQSGLKGKYRFGVSVNGIIVHRSNSADRALQWAIDHIDDKSFHLGTKRLDK